MRPGGAETYGLSDLHGPGVCSAISLFLSRPLHGAISLRGGLLRTLEREHEIHHGKDQGALVAVKFQRIKRPHEAEHPAGPGAALSCTPSGTST